MEPFSILEPKDRKNGLVFNSPHSGIFVPETFEASLAVALKKLTFSSDNFVDRLLENIPRNGAGVFLNHYLRSYIDTNRAPYELDPDMIEGDLSALLPASHKDIPLKTSAKVRKGFGLLARTTHDRQEIYKDKLSQQEIKNRLDDVYYPIHHALENHLNSIKRQQGYYLLVDCHSMPSLAFINPYLKENHQPDIILGNCYNQSCPDNISDFFFRFFKDQGLDVVFNSPYAGGYNTLHYAAPEKKQFCIQIEINRALYMDEEKLTPHEGLFGLQDMMAELALQLNEKITSLI